MTYKPRKGDRIKVELSVHDTGFGAFVPGYVPAVDFSALLAEGKIELVAHAEPDWQVGDIGQHIESGVLYALTDEDAGDLPWFCPTGGQHDYTWWFSRAELAGKLRRCTVTPEDDQ